MTSMTRRDRMLVLGLAVVGAALLAASSAPAASPSGTLVPACVEVHTESRYVPYGYNHIVILTNGCVQTATCIVTTDVNPTPITATVQAGATTEVLTFMASPHPSFVATVACQLHGPGA